MAVKCKWSAEATRPRPPPFTQLRPIVSPVVFHQADPPPSIGLDLPPTPGSLHEPLKYFFHVPGLGLEIGARATNP